MIKSSFQKGGTESGPIYGVWSQVITKGVISEMRTWKCLHDDTFTSQNKCQIGLQSPLCMKNPRRDGLVLLELMYKCSKKGGYWKILRGEECLHFVELSLLFIKVVILVITMSLSLWAITPYAHFALLDSLECRNATKKENNVYCKDFRL